MIYADLPAGANVFLDASIFIHHFEPNPLFGPAATQFLERIENQEIQGTTATHVVSEVAHRLMTIEAMQAFGWKSPGIALRLRNHPTQVQALKHFRQAVQEIPLFGIPILTIDAAWLDRAAEISQQTGLLHNDALVIAVMRAHGLTNLASADPDFDRMPGITRYAPQ
ncbi:MAG: PIN domain-containing protein [Planctomycetes bacterium]|nr:PIN domain-containing protein [Planctomycetota bacterium]